MRHAGEEGERRDVEREVAAALESVFPRIGLKSFVGMSGDDKRTQLAELANIILGIRLFNKDIGKGGAGLDDTVNLVAAEIGGFGLNLQNDVQEVRRAWRVVY